MHPLQLEYVKAKQEEFDAFLAHQKAKEKADKIEKDWREVYVKQQQEEKEK